MGRVNNLMEWGQLLLKVPEQIALCLTMQRQTRFIEEEHHRCCVIFHLSELHQK